MSEATRVARSLTSHMLGQVVGTDDGPTVVVSAGIHGNEPAGLVAVQRVLALMPSLPLRGTMMGLAGNLGALRTGRRFATRDLNRRWTPAEVARVMASSLDQLTDEDREQHELLEILQPLLANATSPITFLDLHSASGEGAPFSCMADVLRNRAIAFEIPVPVVLGLEEVVEGAMLGYLCDLGHVGVAVEGGSHLDPDTVDHHEAAIWCALVAAGCLRAPEVPDYGAHRARLQTACAGLPRFVEICQRYVVHKDDGFEMAPGHRNFQPVCAHEPVATDRKGPVEAGTTGLMMLPRYQGQGEDGFFVAKPTPRFWLRVSAALRGLRLERLITLAPGVRRNSDEPGTFLADPKIARWRTTDLFHLFGFRRACSRTDGLLVYSRRRPDRAGVRQVSGGVRALAAAESCARLMTG